MEKDCKVYNRASYLLPDTTEMRKWRRSGAKLVNMTVLAQHLHPFSRLQKISCGTSRHGRTEGGFFKGQRGNLRVNR